MSQQELGAGVGTLEQGNACWMLIGSHLMGVSRAMADVQNIRTVLGRDLIPQVLVAVLPAAYSGIKAQYSGCVHRQHSLWMRLWEMFLAHAVMLVTLIFLCNLEVVFPQRERYFMLSRSQIWLTIPFIPFLCWSLGKALNDQGSCRSIFCVTLCVSCNIMTKHLLCNLIAELSQNLATRKFLYTTCYIGF